MLSKSKSVLSAFAAKTVRLCSGTTADHVTSFGFEAVTEKGKAEKVHKVFSSVASSYDIMNDVMSFGLHRLWKDYFVQKLSPSPGTRVLDVAGGTGDIASRVVTYKEGSEGAGSDNEGAWSGPEVTVLDINEEMLTEGKLKHKHEGVSWVLGDALSLPFPNASFDAYTIVFGIRNMANFDQALSEAARVLVPGGHFLCMEFCQVRNPLIKTLYDTYSFQVIPVLGELIAKDRDSYQYLVESIRKFPDQDTFADMMKDAGLCHVDYETLAGNIVAIHSGFKPLNS